MLKRATLVVTVAVACLLATVPAAFAAFGFEGTSLSVINRDGTPAVQAGSHPWAMTTAFGLTERLNASEEGVPDGNVKDVRDELPAGLVGDPSATPKCKSEAFHTPGGNPFSGASCPGSTQVGIAQVRTVAGLQLALTFGIYNLDPPPGVPAEFGFNAIGAPILFEPSLRTGGDYGLTVSSEDTSQDLNIFGVSVTLWGAPADPAHNAERGECLALISIFGELPEESRCTEEEILHNGVDYTPKPFLRLPTNCTSGPLGSTLDVDSWQEPGLFVPPATAFNEDSEGHPVGLEGCEKLDFRPRVTLAPESSQTNTPTGLTADVSMPQNTNINGLGEADLKKAVVTLPAGISASPSAADGLAVCTPQEIELHGNAQANCPDASKVGTVEIHTPLLEKPLEGAVYVAQQGNNPFGSLLALYVVAEGPGLIVKLAGEVHLDESTGQVTTTFDNNPQLPFEDLKLKFFGGARAALSTPAACGTYAAEGTFTPWSATAAAGATSSPFTIDTGCTHGFAPSFTAGSKNSQGAGFSPFSVTLSRTDQDQFLGGVSVTTPPGLLGMLSQVPLCGEPQAKQGTCPQASRIGHVSVAAGPGSDPVWVGGEAFLTGPYKDGPFGLSIVVPVKAGPFDLGVEHVQATIHVDPHTAQITIVSDPLPTIRDGIPLQIKTINVTVDREGFTFNPTNCEPLSVGGTITSTQGSAASLSSRFQAANCGLLPFKPKFSASSQAKTSRAGGASLDVKIGYPKGTQANIRKVAVSLPKQLPSRLTTIQKACPEATFAANPSSCPAGSNIGTAKATTPVLNVPLAGPAYLVSHGGAAFPDLVLVLQGQGVTLNVVGAINISKGGITSSTFSSVPDAPISGFELKLPEGTHSALTTNLPAKAKRRLCGSKLVMPTTITGQNGAQIKQSTKIAITGCPKKAAKKVKKAKAGKH